jgi:hypothetical protein
MGEIFNSYYLISCSEGNSITPMTFFPTSSKTNHKIIDCSFQKNQDYESQRKTEKCFPNERKNRARTAECKI